MYVDKLQAGHSTAMQIVVPPQGSSPAISSKDPVEHSSQERKTIHGYSGAYSARESKKGDRGPPWRARANQRLISKESARRQAFGAVIRRTRFRTFKQAWHRRGSPDVAWLAMKKERLKVNVQMQALSQTAHQRKRPPVAAQTHSLTLPTFIPSRRRPTARIWNRSYWPSMQRLL
ncbi:hypothetical protein SKAU_G00336960 [Synaphobranchus kaupii]|uniref:Uncharacterized protein n=1 Tax=Synaphobranchus kaupii TaxID=118154 RepID=A0A9Q1EM67_SYNKA|nr:hypothetical protein SKAU_G00336960 [Synaphobranchus kaupii]